jgi:hypothetical protein
MKSKKLKSKKLKSKGLTKRQKYIVKVRQEEMELARRNKRHDR